MVTYVEFTERLARGQLKNTSAVEDTNLGEIVPDYEATILNLTNQGLVDMTTRMPLIKKLIDLTFVEDQAEYALDNGAAAYLDASLTEAFVPETFVKVLDIYDSTGDLYVPSAGTRYQPNSGGHITSPNFNTLRFSAAYRDSTKTATYIGPKVRVQYQAMHVAITDDADVLNLPPSLVIALQYFVASQYIADMGGKEHTNRGDGYYAMYLRAVGEDVILNTSGTSEVEEHDRFTDNGFV